jgi:dUTP pyrophosphatase
MTEGLKMKVKVKLANKGKLPQKAHVKDACYDVYATSINDLGDGRIEYKLGIHLQPEDLGHGIQFDFRPRSSIHKTGLILSNCIGTGDENYTGEYKAIFYNIIKELPNYKVGDRILQMQVTQPLNIEFEVVNHLSETSRGNGGFGSTGS